MSDNKKNAKEFSETLKKSGDFLKQEITKRGLDKDKQLTEKVKKISEQCEEASKYVKERLEP